MFNKEMFEQAFAATLANLEGAERVTKAALLDLSRSVLAAHHETQDISYINRLIAVLTPVNKKVAILYFQAFSGFLFSKEKQEFSKKDKKNYDEVHVAALKFLDDPLNNIWSWAAREVDIEAKEFDEERMKKQLESTLKKADKAGFTQEQVLRAMLAAGLKLDTLMVLVDELA